MYKLKFSAHVEFPSGNESWEGFVSLDDPETLRELESDVPSYTYATMGEAENAAVAFLGEDVWGGFSGDSTTDIWLEGGTVEREDDGERWTYRADITKV